MRLKPFYLMMLCVLALAADVKAQGCDPWIVQIYQQVYNRTPTAQECNIRNYNNGSWSSYDQLVSLIKTYNANKGSTAPANCDPWIAQIYQQVYGRVPTTEECNIRNYNGGSWSSYEQLTGFIKSYQSKKQPTNNRNTGTAKSPAAAPQGDPWIVKAYSELYNRYPLALELNIKLYNNGSWNNYNELKQYVKSYQDLIEAVSGSGLYSELVNNKMLMAFDFGGTGAINVVDSKTGNILATGGSASLALLKNEGYRVEPGTNKLIDPQGNYVVAAGSANVIAPGGGNLVNKGGMVIAPGGGNVIAPGGGNVIAPGGGNVIAPGGGNVISAGGANINMFMDAAGLRIGSSRTVQSAGTKVIPISAGNALIISASQNTGRR